MYLKFAVLEAMLAFLPIGARSIARLIQSDQLGDYELAPDFMFAGSILSAIAVLKYVLTIVRTRKTDGGRVRSRVIWRMIGVTLFAFLALYLLGLFSVSAHSSPIWWFVLCAVPAGGFLCFLRAASDYYQATH